MPTFLVKTEPGDFSFDDLVKAKRVRWDGVSNPGALVHLRTIRKGDDVLVYHTGGQKAVVGLARAATDAYEDPGKPGTNDAGAPKVPVVDLEPVRPAKTPVTLATVKADARFAGFALVHQGRLSVMPVPEDLAMALRRMAGLVE